MGETNLGPGDLSLARLAAQLDHRLHDLRGSRCTGRMALRHEAAARIDWEGAADGGVTALQECEAFAAAAESELFVIKNLRDAKRVVNLGETNVGMKHSILGIG